MVKPTSNSAFGKLFMSHKDVYSLHKVLGFSCLLSFVTRFARAGERDCGFDETLSTPLTLALHLLLSLSSLFFKIPSKRMGGDGFRIWPEYRLHSIAFACRSVALMTFTYIWNSRDVEDGIWTCVVRIAVVLLTCLAADLSSNFVGEASRSNTIRDLNTHAITRFFFSAMQINATAQCLYGFRRYTVQFVFLFIIQFNAFLMTLQRKNLVSHHVVVALYAKMLLLGGAFNTCEMFRVGVYWMLSSFANMAAVLRMRLHLNKYVMWTSVGILLHVAGPSHRDLRWLCVYLVTTAIQIGLGIFNIYKSRLQLFMGLQKEH